LSTYPSVDLFKAQLDKHWMHPDVLRNQDVAKHVPAPNIGCFLYKK